MRILALLPTPDPPPYLVALAAAGHDVHLARTIPGGQPRHYAHGVTSWSLGYWWRALQSAAPHVLLTQQGDKPAAAIARRAKLPQLQLPASTIDASTLEAELAAMIPADAARPAADALARQTPDVMCWMHYGIPYRRAGSEVMMHHLLRALQGAGYQVAAVTSEMPEAPEQWQVDGVEYRQLPHASAELLIRRSRPRVLVTHHHLAPQAISLAHDIGARAVLVKHNNHPDQGQRLLQAGPDLVVYNTRWVLESLRGRFPEADRIPSLVVHPPVDPSEHCTEMTGDEVTLVNLNADKGVATWRGAAGLLPQLRFLGVMGAHGPQETRPLPANAVIIGQTSDMRRDVWARTRVLLVPSVYESYGMVAVEALASGIPVIAHPTPGLREALGEAAVFIDRDDHQAWAEAIRGLYRGGRRRGAARRAARERSRFLADQTARELQDWVQAVKQLA